MRALCKYTYFTSNHRARMLEEELWSIIAVGEIVDTTPHATLYRFGIKAPDPEE